MLLESSTVPLVLATIAEAQTDAEAVWVWSGNLGPTTATVKARVRGTPRDLHLLVSIHPRLLAARRLPSSGHVIPSEGGVATFPLEGLAPHVHYFYAVADGARQLATGELTTLAQGPMSFQFAFASCAGGSVLRNVSNAAVFRTLEQRRPLFMLHMGDFHYLNIRRNDVSLFRRAYDSVLTQPRQASFYRQTPIVYVWDDHDYGPDDSDRTSPARDAARLAYDEHVPHYPLTMRNGKVTSIQQEFTVGRVRFIVSDLRSERDPIDAPDGPQKSMLGSNQRAWLDDAFKRAAADDVPLLMWVSSVPWITHTGDRKDGWQPYALERQWIADRIASYGLTRRLVVLSGDAHMVAIDDGTHSNYESAAKPGERGFPVVQAAPLDRSPSIKGGPYSHGVSANNYQFGWVEVEDSGADLRVVITGHDGDGQPLRGMRLELSCRGGACALTP